MENILFKFPENTLVRISMKYDWRDEYEKEVIALFPGVIHDIDNTPDRLRKLAYLKMPVCTENPEAGATALDLGIYESYKYTINSVDEKDAELWAKSARKFMDGKFAAEIPERVKLYRGGFFYYKGV